MAQNPERAGGEGRRGFSQDALAGAFLLAVAAIALFASRPLRFGTLMNVGPGFVPTATAILLAGFGVALLANGLRGGGGALDRLSLRGPFFILAGVAGFAATVQSVGLLVACPIAGVLGAAAARETRPLEIVVFVAFMTIACTLLFKYALGLPLPALILPGLVSI